MFSAPIRHLFGFSISVLVAISFSANSARGQNTVTLGGRVVYSTGQPATDASVTLTKTIYDVTPNIVTNDHATTDAFGRFSFQVEPRCSVVYETQATSPEIIDAEPLPPSGVNSSSGCVLNPIDLGDLIITKPSLVVTGGFVTDQFGLPASDATVTMTRIKYNVTPNIVTTAQTMTDGAGHYFFQTYARCGVELDMQASYNGRTFPGIASTSGCVLFFNDGLNLRVNIPSCDSPTFSTAGLKFISSSTGWSMTAEVTANDGLVLRDITLKKTNVANSERYMAKMISVPYFVVETSALPSTRGELKPDSDDQYARSRLVDFRISPDNDNKLIVSATYVIDRISTNSSRSCLMITQLYEFDSATVGCEPSETLPCAPFKPMILYKFNGDQGEALSQINVVQRLHFQVDGIAANSAGIFRDCDKNPFLGGCILDGGGPIFASKQNPVFNELFYPIIGNGVDLGTWDNYHQTTKKDIDEPLIRPGCPECVHIHWRWSAFQGTAFNSGQPIIPQGSNQDVDFAIVRYHSGEEHPDNLLNLWFDREPLRLSASNPLEVVFYYSATGHQTQDSFFIHGGFFNPATPNVSVSANGVDVTYAHLYEDGPLSVTLIDPASAGALPSGYVPYSGLAYEIQTNATVSGPHMVIFHVPSVTDPTFLSTLKVFHGENGILVDRTAASDFSNKTITAQVDSFSPFVIAMPSNRPPVARTKNITVSANSSCNATISAIDVDAGSFDPDAGDTITLSLDSPGPFGLGQHTITLTATDHHGASSTATATVTVVDNTAPVITLNGNTPSMWPPNHKYQTFQVTDFVTSVLDNCSGVTVSDVIINKVTSDEAENGPGSGNTLNDIVISADKKSVQLRAEREGGGDGRVYTFYFKLTDTHGNSTTVTAKVVVPHNPGETSVDNGVRHCQGACP